MRPRTVAPRSGLHRLAERIERGMVWKWRFKAGFSYEVSEESARLRREESDEKRRGREEQQGYQGRVGGRLGLI